MTSVNANDRQPSAAGLPSFISYELASTSPDSEVIYVRSDIFEFQIKGQSKVQYPWSNKPVQSGHVDSFSMFNFRNGVLHSDGDNPSVVEFDHYGGVSSRAWHREGSRHRGGGLPASVRYYAGVTGGGVSELVWFVDNEYCRGDDLPAHVTYRKNGFMYEATWYVNGKHYREDDKPSYITYDVENKVNYMYWFRGDDIHRDGDMPAIVMFNDKGVLSSLEWLVDDHLHREGAPASLNFNSDGELVETDWYYKGNPSLKDRDWVFKRSDYAHILDIDYQALYGGTSGT